jgi:hypothetical protein
MSALEEIGQLFRTDHDILKAHPYDVDGLQRTLGSAFFVVCGGGLLRNWIAVEYL